MGLPATVSIDPFYGGPELYELYPGYVTATIPNTSSEATLGKYTKISKRIFKSEREYLIYKEGLEAFEGEIVSGHLNEIKEVYEFESIIDGIEIKGPEIPAGTFVESYNKTTHTVVLTKPATGVVALTFFYAKKGSLGKNEATNVWRPWTFQWKTLEPLYGTPGQARPEEKRGENTLVGYAGIFIPTEIEGVVVEPDCGAYIHSLELIDPTVSVELAQWPYENGKRTVKAGITIWACLSLTKETASGYALQALMEKREEREGFITSEAKIEGVGEAELKKLHEVTSFQGLAVGMQVWNGNTEEAPVDKAIEPETYIESMNVSAKTITMTKAAKETHAKGKIQFLDPNSEEWNVAYVPCELNLLRVVNGTLASAETLQKETQVVLSKGDEIALNVQAEQISVWLNKAKRYKCIKAMSPTESYAPPNVTYWEPQTTHIYASKIIWKDEWQSVPQTGYKLTLAAKNNATEQGGESEHLTKEKWYAYCVVIYNFNGEPLRVSNVTAVKSGNGAQEEKKSNWNTNKVEFALLLGAYFYKIFRSPLAGEATEAAALESELTFLLNVIEPNYGITTTYSYVDYGKKSTTKEIEENELPAQYRLNNIVYTKGTWEERFSVTNSLTEEPHGTKVAEQSGFIGLSSGHSEMWARNFRAGSFGLSTATTPSAVMNVKLEPRRVSKFTTSGGKNRGSQIIL